MKLDKVVINSSLSDSQLYFKIKGSDKLLYWSDYGEYPGAIRAANFNPKMRVIIHFGLDSLWNKLALLIALRDAYVSY